MKKHRRSGKTEFLDGVFRRLLFSRSGHVSGVVLRVDRGMVSVSLEPHEGAAILRLVELGRKLPVLAVRSDAPAAAGEGDVRYAFTSLATTQGRPRGWPPA